MTGMSDLVRRGRGPDGEWEFYRPGADVLERFMSIRSEFGVSMVVDGLSLSGWEAAERAAREMIAELEAMPVWRRPIGLGTVWNDGRVVVGVDDDALRLTFDDGAVIDAGQVTACLATARLVEEGC